MKKISIKSLITLLAAVLVVTASIGIGFAYFSDYDMGRGIATLHLSGTTTIDEGNSDTEKQIVITNTGDKASVVVRCGVFGPDKMELNVPDTWKAGGDGFYYYTSVLAPGESTSGVITAKIPDLTEKEIQELGDTLNITVVHESAAVVYNEDDTVSLPDNWDQSIVIK